MTQKERLVELIINSVDGCAKYWAEIIADHLLSNGVIVPPCKVGDVVYLIMAAYSTLDKSTYFAVPIEGVVDCISFCGERGNEIDIRLNSNFGGEIVYRTFEDYKKSFFLDRKEAAAALDCILNRVPKKDITDEEAEQALKEREK